MARNRQFIEDLDEYEGAEDVERIHMAPLAVGFLQRKQRFETGSVTAKFTDKLLAFCHPDISVFALPQAMPCPICNARVEMEIGGEMVRLGSAEIRVLGETDIYASPDLLPHYIEAHDYLPPDEFVDAVMKGSGVNSAEYRALINALR